MNDMEYYTDYSNTHLPLVQWRHYVWTKSVEKLEQQPLSAHSLYCSFPYLYYVYISTAITKYVRSTQTTPKTQAVAIKQQSPTLRRRIRWSSQSKSISRRYHSKQSAEQQVPTPFHVQFWQRKYICTYVCTVDCATGLMRAMREKHVTFWLKAYRNLDK